MGTCCSSGPPACSNCEGEGRIATNYRTVTCSNCNGNGNVTVEIECKTCNGSTYKKCHKCNGKRTIKKCDQCNGNGNEICEHCEGIGTNEKTKKFYNRTKQCDNCNGSGIPPCNTCEGSGKSNKHEICTSCNGDKKVKIPLFQTCKECNGSGVFVKQKVKDRTQLMKNNEESQEIL
eukprot:553399_1